MFILAATADLANLSRFLFHMHSSASQTAEIISDICVICG
ncbi:MAG: hypothetical protein GQF41_0397 [Candidatus Rifleibacterium amylolyticum]|nr:MAG: hypothetical protein GQF41_0397 [Candidatus Rifleibacterium amylolyticum]